MTPKWWQHLCSSHLLNFGPGLELEPKETEPAREARHLLQVASHCAQLLRSAARARNSDTPAAEQYLSGMMDPLFQFPILKVSF